MDEREAAIQAFLARHGMGDAFRVALPGDASARRYERLRQRGRTLILMDAAPDKGLQTGPFCRIGAWLGDQGWSAPSILAVDETAGLILMEDLGPDLFHNVLEHGADPHRLYGAAIDLLAALQATIPPIDLPPYDLDKMSSEAALLTEWYTPGLGSAAKAVYLEAWQDLLPTIDSQQVFVHVDYHAENLLWLPKRKGDAKVGLLDFQDARLGHPAYDLVSLLEDARRDVAPALAAAMIDRYLALHPMLAPDAFRTAYAILSAQRNCKILGLFTRLAKRDAKPRYLAHLDRVRGHLQQSLTHPALASLKAWFDNHVNLNIAS